MNVLIVTAHPSSRGFTHQIAGKYMEVSKAKGHNVKLLNLYEAENAQEFLRFEDIKEDLEKHDDKRAKMQNLISWSNHIVFVHPMWWFDTPAILKNWIDVNFMAHFAFRYRENGYPVGLLNDKTADIFITCDMPKVIYYLLFSPIMDVGMKGRISFCGMKVQNRVIFDLKRKASQEKLDDWLKQVEQIANKL